MGRSVRPPATVSLLTETSVIFPPENSGGKHGAKNTPLWDPQHRLSVWITQRFVFTPDGEPTMVEDWWIATAAIISLWKGLVIWEAPHQKAQLRGVSPQSCRRASVVVVCDMWGEEMKRSMLLPSAPTLRLHVPFIIFLSNQLSWANPRYSV